MISQSKEGFPMWICTGFLELSFIHAAEKKKKLYARLNVSVQSRGFFFFFFFALSPTRIWHRYKCSGGFSLRCTPCLVTFHSVLENGK